MNLRKKLTFTFLLIILFFSILLTVKSVNAQGGGLRVYVLNLDGVGGDDTGWVASRADIVSGAMAACAINGSEMNVNVPWFHADVVGYNQFYDVQVTVVTSWDIYKQLVVGAAPNDIEGLIFLNTLGQIFPVPSGETKEAWMAIIANLMLHYRATWISTNGYPFYEVTYQNGIHEDWGVGGFDYFLSFINLQGRECWPPGWPPSINEGNYATIDPSFNQQVVPFGFPRVNDFGSAAFGRPLNLTDFKQNVQIVGYQADNYAPVAMLTYASPGSYADTHGFGSYVHIGAKSFNAQGVHSSDWGRGYIGMAMALNRAVAGFVGSESSLGSWQNMYNHANIANYCIAVCPSINQEIDPRGGSYYEIGLSFPITVALNSSFWSNGGSSATLLGGSSVQFDLGVNSTDFPDVQIKLDRSLSLIGNATVSSGPVFRLPLVGNVTQDQLDRLSNDIQYGLSFVPIVSQMLSYGQFLQLWSQWWAAPDIPLSQGVDSYSSAVHFGWQLPADCIAHYVTSKNSDGTCNITEQASASFYVLLEIPTSGRYNGWYQIPLQYNISITPNAYSPIATPITVENTSNLDLYIIGSTAGNGQYDAGQQWDAPNNAGSARPLNYPPYGQTADYYGYLDNYEPVASDLVDWYKFYLPSAATFNVILLSPQQACYNLSLYSASDWSNPVATSNETSDGAQQTIQYSGAAGWWYVEVGQVDGSGIYKLTIGDAVRGGGCPFVCPWNGTAYVADNNILPRSESSNGSDVQDYYRLGQPLLPNYVNPFFSIYSLKISEFENEHDYLNQVKMYAVDHAQNVNVGVSPTGQILTYQDPQPALLVQDENGRDWTQTLSSIDNNCYQSAAGDYLTLYFGQVNASNAKLVLRDDLPPIKQSIHVQLLMANGSLVEVGDIPGRENMTTDVLDLSPYLQTMSNPVEVRLCFTAVHRVDYVGLDTTLQAPIHTSQALMISAVHSVYGNVLPQLILNDSQYAELTPGQQITITFLLPTANPAQTRTFILYVEGHYYTIHQ